MLKAALVNHCLSILMNRAASADKQLQDLKEDLQGESKSSAGDKHETGRAMVQLEMEKLADQRKDLQLMLDKWSQIDFSKDGKRIEIGSLVITDSGSFLIAIALGSIEFDKKAVVVLSPQSPLGIKLMGKKPEDLVEVNGRKFTISAVL
jgi:transcription elongation GreA/GreB family factor